VRSSIGIPTGSLGPSGLAEEKNVDLFVADGPEVLEYSQGNAVAPIAMIQAAGNVVALAVDADNHLYVGLHNEVDVYAPGSTTISSRFTAINVCGITVVPGAVR